MIYLPDFPELIQSKFEDPTGLLPVFLNFLFGDEIELRDEANLTINGVGSYQQVAILGYRLNAAPKNNKGLENFRSVLVDYTGTSMQGSSLPSHAAAMLGIGLGIAILKDKDCLKWFRETLLPEIPQHEQSKGLRDFLRVIVDPNFNAINSIPCDEYKLFLAAWPGQKGIPDLQEELKSYFVQHRKAPFLSETAGKGLEASFFQSMLSVYIMDRCLQMSVWEPQAVSQLTETTLSPVWKYVSHNIKRSAMVIASLATLACFGLMVFLTWQFFQYEPWNPISKQNWSSIEDAVYLFGGPVSFFYLFVRTVLTLLGKKGITFEVESLASLIAKPRIKRRFKAMSIKPPPQNF